MLKPFVAFGLLTFACLASLRADLAPTQFVGSGIVPQANTAIRMEKADVEIVWGTPCSLVATFAMVNPSAEPQALEVGFPITREFPYGIYEPGMKPEPLSMTFDGIEAAVAVPPVRLEDNGNQVWYRSTHTFKPGKTVVTVKTILRASNAYSAPFRESLFYCIETGGRWAGTIGEETVTIRFPYLAHENQIAHAAPAGFKVEGDSVRWHLVDIEPKGKEFDIKLTYLRPDVMQFLETLRREVAGNQENAALKIKLARNLFSLGTPKSNVAFPIQLSEDTYQALLSKMGDAKSREVLAYHYLQNAAGVRTLAHADGSEKSRLLSPVLANAGYRDETSRSLFIREAESLLESLLKAEPQNSEAWNVYLANYWRLSFNAVGSWYGSWTFPDHQIRAIETAALNCPNDECIQLWLKLRQTPRQQMNIEPLREMMKTRGYYDMDFPFLPPDARRPR